MPIVLSDRGACGILTDAERQQLQAQWQRDHAVILPGFFDAPLLEAVRTEIRAHGEFRAIHYDASGDEQKMADTRLVWRLDFLMNDPPLWQAISAVTGASVHWFNGRVYRLTPGTGEGHDWHDDIDETRRLGVSVNLSDGMFEGGQLQLRDFASQRLLSEVVNRVPGDAVVFRIGEDLEHRVLPVEGGVPRLAYAGWFHDGPPLQDKLKALVSG